MTNLATQAFQQALYGALSADPALAGMVSGIYDYVPEDATPPYVYLRPLLATPWEDVERQGHYVHYAVECITRGTGHKEALTLADAVHALLHHQSLVLSGFELLSMTVERLRSVAESDGFTYRSTLEITAVTRAMEE